MKIIYSNENYSSLETNSLFLAGPTPRSKDVKSWRPEALEFLKNSGFTGTVLVPEFSSWEVQFDYDNQVQWEFQGLMNCGKIVFWIPSDEKDMPALTTRTEFGMFMALRPKDVIYGRPKDAWKLNYLDWWYNKITDTNPVDNLQDTLTRAMYYAVSSFAKACEPKQYFKGNK